MSTVPMPVPIPAGARDPAFRLALDPTAVAALVRHHLVRTTELVALHPDYVRWKEDDGSLLGYRVVVRDADGLGTTYVTIRTAAPHRLADEAERLRHREDEDHRGLAAVALVPGHNLLLLAFPIDRAMHDLRRLVQASKFRSLLGNACPDFLPAGHRFSKSRSHLRLVRYKPERRAVLQWQVGAVDAGGASQAPRPVWLRCHAEATTASTLATIAATAAGVCCPVPLAVVHERLVLEPHLDGSTWDPATSPHALPTAAATLARLHEAEPPPSLPLHGPVQALDLALRATHDLARLAPELGDTAHRLADRLATQLPPQEASVLAHGDLHAGQFLRGDDDTFALVDFDRACRAPAAHDLAVFRAHSLLLDPRHGEAAANAFADAYAIRAPLPHPGVQRWWDAVALLRIASQPFRSLRADWPSATAMLLARAEARLDGSPGGES